MSDGEICRGCGVCAECCGSCGCADCCSACWYDCCACAEGIILDAEFWLETAFRIDSCGLTDPAQVDFLIFEWAPRNRHPELFCPCKFCEGERLHPNSAGAEVKLIQIANYWGMDGVQAVGDLDFKQIVHSYGISKLPVQD